MRMMIIGLLLGTQFAAADAASAADLVHEGSAQTPKRGGFVGARIRLPLGDGSEKAQAGLALAGVERSRETGETRLSTGLELGFAKGTGLQLAIAGRAVPLDQAERRKAGVSTLGWVAIGAGVAALAYVAWVYKEMSEPRD